MKIDKLSIDGKKTSIEVKDNIFSSKINETLIEETLPSTKTSDPLTPLDQNYVTLDQLQQHYRLFLNRIQTQLSTLGGGGETRLQYLDDIVGVATNLSEYDGKFLKVDTSQPAGKNFVFETVSGGGGGSTGAGGTWATFDSNTGITTTKKVKISNDLEVTGVVTATTFKGNLEGNVTGDIDGNLRGSTLNVTGVTTFESTVNLGDNDRLNFNDTNTSIYGDSSNLNIEAAGTRNVSIKVNAAGGTSGDIILKTGNTESVKVNGDGGVIVTGVTTIGNVVIGGGTTDLVVTGDARVTGILTIGTGSITLNPTEKKISGVDEIEIGSGTTAITIKKTETGEIKFTDENGDEKSVGIGTTVSINTSGIITATTLAGTLQTAAQPNVTSLGTLSSLNVTGDVSVGGTLTYEDVTNIDSVGLITARNGIEFGLAGVCGTIRAN